MRKVSRQFEKFFIRPFFAFIYPYSLRLFISKASVFIRLKFKPIQYKYISCDRKLGDKLCIFVSYQPRGILRTTWKYIKHLSEDLGYSIVFVANCKLKEDDIVRLNGLCIEIIERDNIGYDFGAYKDGILRYIDKLDNLKDLLIANDSVIAPIYDMRPIYDKLDSEDCDFWGINDAHEIDDLHNFNNVSKPYIGSFFINFKSIILKSDVFKNFWRDMFYPDGRKYAVRNEIKISQVLLNNKFKYSVFLKKEDVINYVFDNRDNLDFDMMFASRYNYKEFNKNYHITMSRFHFNTTCPLLVLSHSGMPCMKRDLIKRDVVNMNIFLAMLNRYEKQLTTIITKEEILDEIGLNPRTENSIFRWKKYIAA